MRESASAHEERAAAQAAGLRLLYHGAAKRPRQNRIHCGFAWFNVLKPCARKRISARRARGRASGGLEVIIPYFRLYVMLSVHICQKTAALCRCGRGCGGEGKMTVRGGEAMAAKRTTAQGGFAQRNAARDFARQTQKAGPVTVRAVSPQVKCDRTGARAGAGTEAACGKRGRPPAVAGTITKSADGVTFLMLRK